MGGACGMYGEAEKCIQAKSFIKEMHTGFWLGNLMVRNHLHDVGIDQIIKITKMALKETGWEMWTGFIWLRAQTKGGLLCKWQ
jgi:hypothetical protein